MDGDRHYLSHADMPTIVPTCCTSTLWSHLGGFVSTHFKVCIAFIGLCEFTNVPWGCRWLSCELVLFEVVVCILCSCPEKEPKKKEESLLR